MGTRSVDWTAQTVGMIGCAGIITEKLMSHEVKTGWCFFDKLVTEMLETFLSFVLVGKPDAVN